MATKSLLNSIVDGKELQDPRALLKAMRKCPDGDIDSALQFPNHEFSKWLGLTLEEKLSSSASWQEAGAIALGSWAREELCPKSDIDLLFCGNEAAVKKVVDEFQEKGLRLRYRVPEDDADWSEGVGEVDWVALLNGKAFSPLAHEKLLEQQEKLRSHGVSFSKKILKELIKEKKERNQRYDSISNFLEPNIKYGRGGLRDIQQALYVIELFPEKFVHAPFLSQLFDYYKNFFLTIRQKLHLLGDNDVLLAQSQRDISDWMGYKNSLNFMREVQKGLSRTSFYTDWVFACAMLAKKKMAEVNARKLRSIHDVFAALRDDPSILMQYRVRRQMDLVFASSTPTQRQIARWIERYIQLGLRDEFVLALFGSRLIDKCIPHIRRLVGLTQHNQYHRYTVDTHIKQCLRGLLEIGRSHKKKSFHSSWTKKLDLFDWKVLVWTCIYHDIGKGLKGDHAIVGAEIAEKDLSEMGLSKKLVSEVVWMVKNHLLLSKAAFRKNPNSRQTWAELHSCGVKKQRVQRLALFTYIDIQATNPEAWNDWKRQLLCTLVDAMEQKEATSYLNLLKEAEKMSNDAFKNFINDLDRGVIGLLPAKVLVKDFEVLHKESKKKRRKDLELLITGSGNEKWVRFHSFADERGTFVDFVQRIYASGASVRQAAVRSSEEHGVYDWFLIRTTKTNAQLRKLLGFSMPLKKKPNVSFEKIEIMSSNEVETVISFRGRDRSGALVAAANAIFDAELEIRWAAVHTWGRMVDDVFGVSTGCHVDLKLKTLHKYLEITNEN